MFITILWENQYDNRQRSGDIGSEMMSGVRLSPNVYSIRDEWSYRMSPKAGIASGMWREEVVPDSDGGERDWRILSEVFRTLTCFDVVIW